MAYTSFETMRAYNTARFGTPCGPFEPELRDGGSDMKTAALRFIREGCEELRFGPVGIREELESGTLSGTGLRKGQIPFNMEKDIDRLCLEKALEDFIDSGSADDAYSVYYCYLEMFIGAYGSTKTMVELLSEFERNGSSLLMKHRDHYSHSVYVFALGLAIYETNPLYRRAFKEFYGFSADESDRSACLRANHFYLQYWGLTSLFHDIGYPFELPFEQVMSYFEVEKTDRGSGVPFMAYRSLEGLVDFSKEEQAHFLSLYGRTFTSVTELFAHDIQEKMGEEYAVSESYLYRKISDKPVHPEKFSFFMDHAFFSACRLYRGLTAAVGLPGIDKPAVDAMSAILLHNSLFKFCIAFYRDAPPKKKSPLSMRLHPLAYMLMLCDALQCWDRTAYGRSSRGILYPMGVDFDFTGGQIEARYHYDLAAERKIAEFNARLAEHAATGEGKKPRLKTYSDMCGTPEENDFALDIRSIVDLSEIPFRVIPDLRPEDRSRKHTYLSGSSFLHLYDFAVLLTMRHESENPENLKVEDYYPKFDRMSLEYRLNHIERAKYFSRYLNQIGCFYTDRPVDFDLLAGFTPEQLEIIAPMEHERWLENHHRLGWVSGKLYETCAVAATGEEEKAERSAIREQLRCHKLIPEGELNHETALRHYLSLPEREQGKDVKPMDFMLKILQRLDGVRIYSIGLPERKI